MYKLILSIMLMVVASTSYAGTASSLPSVKDVNKAIQRQGAKWVAKENNVTKMTDAQRELLTDSAREVRPTFSSSSSRLSSSSSSRNINGGSYPATLDYRNINGKNYTTVAKNQSSCGACVFFAGTATLESLIKLKTDLPQWNLDLSEQYFLSCLSSRNCVTGGVPEVDFLNLINMGLPEERHAPYINQKSTCAAVTPTDIDSIGNYRITSMTSLASTLDPNNPNQNISPSIEEYKKTLNDNGPFVAIMRTYSDFYAYGSGVYSYTSGGYVGLHAVTVVGYDDVEQCFIAKNSWGPTWGEGGFFRIAYSETLWTSKTWFAVENYILEGAFVYRTEGPITPTASVTVPPSAMMNSRSWTFSVVAGDTYTYKYRLDGGSYSAATPVATPLQLENMYDGSHTLEIIACSDLGLCQSLSTPTTYTWTVDATPAPVQILNDPNGATINTSYLTLNIGGEGVVRYDYTLDSVNWTMGVPVATPINITNMTDGYYSIVVVGIDAAGNQQGTSTSWRVVFNNLQAGAMQVASPTKETEVTVYASQTGGADVYRHSLDNGPFSANIPFPVDGGNPEIHYTNLSNGGHTITLIVEDTTKGISSTPSTVSWTVDIVAPMVTLTNTPATSTTDKTASIIVGGEDVKAYKYKLDGAENYSYSEAPVDVRLALSNLTAGVHTLRVIGRDDLGNWQQTPTTITWTITSPVTPDPIKPDPIVPDPIVPDPIVPDPIVPDPIIPDPPPPPPPVVPQPTIQLFNIPTNGSTITNPDLSILVRGDGLVSYSYTLDNVNWVRSQPIATPISLTNMINGYYTLMVTGVNSAGAQCSISTGWRVSENALQVTLSGTPANITSSREVSVTVTGSRVTTGYKYKLDGIGDYSAFTSLATTLRLTNLQDGNHYLDVIASNNTSNSTVPVRVSWIVDTVAPVVTLTDCPDTSTPSRSANISVGGDGVQAYQYKLDSGTYGATTDKSVRINLSSLTTGKHTLSVIGQDSAGNWQPTPTIITWSVTAISSPKVMPIGALMLLLN